MSTKLYRKNEDGSIEEISIPGEHVQASLDAGFVPSKADLEPKEAPTREEADTNGSGKLSTQEIRDAAEKAGIDDFKTKRIKTLMKELGYDDEASTD